MNSYLPQMTLDSVYVGALSGNPIYVEGTKMNQYYVGYGAFDPAEDTRLQ